MRYGCRHYRWIVLLVLALTGACTAPVVHRSPGLTVETLPPLFPSEPLSVPAAAESSTNNAYYAGEMLRLPEALRGQLRREIAPITSTRRRADRLLQFLFEDTGLGLSYQYDANLSPAEVYDRGVGNCISLSMMVVASAREVGLDARFQEVRTDRNWKRVGSVFFMDRHVNVRFHGILATRDYVVDLRPTPATMEQPVQALSDRETFGHFYNNLAALALSRDEDRLALTWFRRALENAPQTAFIWANLGTLYLRHEHYQATAGILEQALALDPREYLAISKLAHVYGQLGREEAAARLADRAEQIRMRNPYYLALLAESALAAERIDDAVRHIDRALQTARDDPALQLLAGRIHLARGNEDLARRSLHRARQQEQQLPENDRDAMNNLALQLEQRSLAAGSGNL